MSIMSLDAERLSKQIGETVTEMEVLIAKNSVMGLDAAGIAELLGVTAAEIQEIQSGSTYRDARLLLASEYARTQTDTDFSWDDIEAEAVKKLTKRVQFENDTDSLLKIAAVANKAQRRVNPNKQDVLGAGGVAQRVPLTLTRRIVHRLGQNGIKEVEETQQISVVDGSAVNPKFEDIDSMLGVSRRPQLPENMTIRTHEPDFTLDDLEFHSK